MKNGLGTCCLLKDEGLDGEVRGPGEAEGDDDERKAFVHVNIIGTGLIFFPNVFNPLVPTLRLIIRQRSDSWSIVLILGVVACPHPQNEN